MRYSKYAKTRPWKPDARRSCREEDVGSTLSLPLLGRGIWKRNRVKFKDGHNKRRKRVDEGFWGGGNERAPRAKRITLSKKTRGIIPEFNYWQPRMRAHEGGGRGTVSSRHVHFRRYRIRDEKYVFRNSPRRISILDMIRIKASMTAAITIVITQVSNIEGPCNSSRYWIIRFH